MAYVRLGQHSDVYVYAGGSKGFVCHWCRVAEGGTTETETAREMIEHLQVHIERGDRVPAHAIAELEITEREPDNAFVG